MSNNLSIKAVIFDLDGVIVHTDIYHYLSWKRIADLLEVHFDEEINHKLRGISRMESLDIILNNAGVKLPIERKEELITEKNEIYKSYLEELKPEHVPQEVVNTLYCLKKQHYKLAIGSSSRNAGMILDKIKLRHLFDAISDGNNITNSKPDPEVFLKAAEYLGEKAEHCIVIEDSTAGIIAGRCAGMKTVAIGDAALAGCADYEISRFSDIPGIILNRAY